MAFSIVPESSQRVSAVKLFCSRACSNFLISGGPADHNLHHALPVLPGDLSVFDLRPWFTPCLHMLHCLWTLVTSQCHRPQTMIHTMPSHAPGYWWPHHWRSQTFESKPLVTCRSKLELNISGLGLWIPLRVSHWQTSSTKNWSFTDPGHLTKFLF